MDSKQHMEGLRAAMREDEYYAWTWHCNLAMPMQDEGMSFAAANRAAARIMKNFFDVDPTKSEFYRDSVKAVLKSGMECDEEVK